MWQGNGGKGFNGAIKKYAALCLFYSFLLVFGIGIFMDRLPKTAPIVMVMVYLTVMSPMRGSHDLNA